MKVIVADDEKWVRSAIIKTIPFERLGMVLACEATNGLEALEMCLLHRPDILITDIMMPGLTGLELIQNVREKLPEIKIVIISGYSDFEYAKTAIKLGVDDYILKPVDENEIYDVLFSLKDRIIQDTAQKNELERLKNQYDSTADIMKESFFNKLINPNFMTLHNIKESFCKYNIRFDLPFYTVIIFEAYITQKSSVSSSNSLYKTSIRNILEGLFNCTVFAHNSVTHQIIAILNHQKDFIPDKHSHDAIVTHLTRCGHVLADKFEYPFHIAISDSSIVLKDLPSLYNNACEALSMKFWDMSQKLFIYNPQWKTNTLSFNIDETALENIIINIKLQNYEPLYEMISKNLNYFKNQNKLLPERIKEYFWSLMQTINSMLEISSDFLEYQNTYMNVSPYTGIMNTASLQGLEAYLKELLSIICCIYEKKYSSDSLTPIQAAQRFLESNYCINITMEQLASYVHLSTTYFSELFKKETGMSFVEYKTLLKIDKAKSLICSTNLSIQEISTKLGYNDSKYFSKIFKKSTGMTVEEFRKHGNG